MLSEKTVLLYTNPDDLAVSLSQRLCEQGASVLLVGENVERLSSFVENVNDQAQVNRDRGRAAVFSMKDQDTTSAIQKASELFGGVDIYIDNHFEYQRYLFRNNSEKVDFSKFVEKNILNSIGFAQTLLPFLESKRHSRILFLLPDSFQIGLKGDAIGSLRSALIAFSKALAAEYYKTETKINCLGIGPTESYLLQRSDGKNINDALKELKEYSHQARVAKAADIAEAICFYCSPNSAAVNGQYILLDSPFQR